MTNTTHYNMTIAEGTDVVNPLTQIFPNFNTIDGAMFANKQAGIGTATEVTTGPVHAVVRANSDSNVFRFTATSAWTAGDTMTLDGNNVIVHMSDGTVPATGAYIIGAEVLAMLTGNLVTLVISSNGGVTSFNTRTGNVVAEASDYSADMVDFDNTNTSLSSTEVQGAIEEVAAAIPSLVPEAATITFVEQTETSGGITRKYTLSNPNNRTMLSLMVFANNFGRMGTLTLPIVDGAYARLYYVDASNRTWNFGASLSDNGTTLSIITASNSNLYQTNYGSASEVILLG